MNPNHFETINFKFKWIDENGHESGILKKRGFFDGENLTLDETEIPADSIAELVVRENRMVLALPTDDGAGFTSALAVYGTNIDALKQAINGARSDVFARLEKEKLQQEGRIEAYRDQKCPHCDATILLTGMQPTPQVYCEFCDTLFTVGTVGPEQENTKFEKDYRICDECGMYSHPRKFTIFYFYFLLVIYGWYSNTTVRCPACMRPEAWKMLFGNLFGFIGLPVAFVQLYRSYSGRTGGGPLKGLDDANILANKGKVDLALEKYDTVMDNVPINAGVKFNIATGLLNKNELDHAEAMYQMSLDDCANYWPSIRGLISAYQANGKVDLIPSLLEQHGLPIEEAVLNPDEIDLD